MKARFAFFGAVALAAGLAACGGGGGSSNPPPTVTPSSTPTPVTSSTVTLGAQPTTAPIPGNVSGSIFVPSGSGTLTIVASSANPSPVPIIQIAHRGVPAASGANVALRYFTATATGGPVTLNGLPGFSATLPKGAPGGTYFVAYYNTSGQTPAWVSTTLAGGTPSSQGVVTIPATTSPTIALANGQSLYLAVYVGQFIPPINISGCVGVNLAAKPSGRSAPAFVGTHPITPGDSYNYTGSLAQTMSRAQPCPQPTATADATVTVGVMMGSGVENSIETDAYATNTTTLTTTANVSLVSGRYLESSETATDGNGNVVTTNYGAHPLQYGQLPEGSGSWTNFPPATVTENLTDGTRILRQYGAAGNYTETETLPGTIGTNTITVSGDGSGAYSVAGVGNVTFSPPTSGMVTINVFGSTLTVPVWYATPVNLYSDGTTDLGAVGSLPQGCTFASSGGGTPDHLQRTLQIVDPVLGYTETQTVDSYDLVNYTGGVTLGPVCAKITDTQNGYYDYSLTTPYAFYFSLNASPVSTNTIVEQLSLTNSGLVAHTTGGAHAFAAQIAARQAGIRFARALQRSDQIRAMSHAFANRSGHAFGGLK